MGKLLVIGLGGFAGALARYGVSTWLNRGPERFPWGTFTANLLGCLLIGLLTGWLQARQPFGEHLRLFLMVGLLGAFTTFSTFGLESFELLRAGRYGLGAGYIVLSFALGLAAVLLGHWAARAALT